MNIKTHRVFLLLEFHECQSLGRQQNQIKKNVNIFLEVFYCFFMWYKHLCSLYMLKCLLPIQKYYIKMIYIYIYIYIYCNYLCIRHTFFQSFHPKSLWGAYTSLWGAETDWWAQQPNCCDYYNRDEGYSKYTSEL